LKQTEAEESISPTVQESVQTVEETVATPSAEEIPTPQ